jgi:hypothetical protein
LHASGSCGKDRIVAQEDGMGHHIRVIDKRIGIL